MLPADVIGNSIFDAVNSRFVFHPGPIFSGCLLIDEINRATPKTQSALLEAMAEGQVSVEGLTHPLPNPFFVIATQNPRDQVGTFPLPESQLDRFSICISLGYPDRLHEREVLQGQDRYSMVKSLSLVFTTQELLSLQSRASSVSVSPLFLDYLQDILDASRLRHPAGLSPRAGLNLLRLSKSWAFISGRDYVIPEDIEVGKRLKYLAIV